MTSAYDHELEVALGAVRQAGRVCRAVQSQITPDVLEKKDRSPVTVADFASQAVVCRVLAEALPDDPVVGEEDAAELRGESAHFLDSIHGHLAGVGIDGSGDEICGWIDRGGHTGGTDATGKGRFWTLDPIDGTKGFLRKQQYAVSLALIVDGQIVLGVLGCPNLPAAGVGESMTGSLLWAVRGAGAFQSPLDEDVDPTPIQVSEITDFALARMCESVESGHSKHDASAHVIQTLGVAADPVRLDSQAKYATVARGDADIYLRLPTRAGYEERIWDHAGGVVIVEEAGGTVTDASGRALDFSCGRTLARNSGVIATAGVDHGAVVSAVGAAMSVSSE